MLKRTTWFLALVLALSAVSVNAEIIVSRKFQTHPLNQAVNIPAGGHWIWPLPGRTVGDSYQVRIGSENSMWKDISAFVVDERNLQLFKAGQQFRAMGRSKTITPFEFGATRAGSEQLYLVVDNRYSLMATKKARVSVTMTTRLDEAEAQRLEKFLGTMYSGIQHILDLPGFDVRVAPCNAVNAFSERDTGNITLCSEFWSMYVDRPSVLIWVFLHELGHTSLGLWGIPGNDNEDMADEFATAISLRSKDGPRMVMEAMDFFREKNPNAEAQNMIQHGGRHSLSIQRIRNIHSWLIEPVRVTAKWNNLLYPHMTEGALQKIIAMPGSYDNVQLAREQLASRSVSSRVITSAEPTRSLVLGCTKDTDCKGMRICEQGACVNPN